MLRDTIRRWRQRSDAAVASSPALHGLLALLGRFSIAATFWASGQTKVEGLAVDLVRGELALGRPRLADSAVDLFTHEYALPLIDPHSAAVLAAVGEHVLPALLLLGAATRLSAFGLLVMTLVIQVFVYPQAYALHGTWATVLLLLVLTGGGRFSLDALLRARSGAYWQRPWTRQWTLR